MTSPCLSFLIYIIGTGLTALLGGLDEPACKDPPHGLDTGSVLGVGIVVRAWSTAPAGRVMGRQPRFEEFRDSPR